MIAETPALLEEARAALPMLQREATEPAGPDGVIAVLKPRLATLVHKDLDEAGWAAFWADYTEVLEHLPVSALDAAMRAYLKQPDSRFFPAPGAILALAESTPNAAVQAYQRASLALTRGAEPPKPRIAPERMAELMADFRRQMAGKGGA